MVQSKERESEKIRRVRDSEDMRERGNHAGYFNRSRYAE